MFKKSLFIVLLISLLLNIGVGFAEKAICVDKISYHLTPSGRIAVKLTDLDRLDNTTASLLREVLTILNSHPIELEHGRLVVTDLHHSEATFDQSRILSQIDRAKLRNIESASPSDNDLVYTRSSSQEWTEMHYVSTSYGNWVNYSTTLNSNEVLPCANTTATVSFSQGSSKTISVGYSLTAGVTYAMLDNETSFDVELNHTWTASTTYEKVLNPGDGGAYKLKWNKQKATQTWEEIYYFDFDLDGTADDAYSLGTRTTYAYKRNGPYVIYESWLKYCPLPCPNCSCTTVCLHH